MRVGSYITVTTLVEGQETGDGNEFEDTYAVFDFLHDLPQREYAEAVMAWLDTPSLVLEVIDGDAPFDHIHRWERVTDTLECAMWDCNTDPQRIAAIKVIDRNDPTEIYQLANCGHWTIGI